MALKRIFKVLCTVIILSGLCLAAQPAPVCAKDLIVGLLLAGAHNDSSYNQFHLDAARLAAANVKGVKIIYTDQANSIARPADVTIPAMIDDLVQKGATLVVANAYEMELGVVAASSHYPEVTFVQIDGDDALVQSERANIINVTVMFDYAQMLAGFAAGMATASGKIAYLGSSPHSESFRQITAAYLGAKYAWETVRGLPLKDFRFQLKWMGNWFDNLSPQEDTKTSAVKLFDGGSDVIMGGNFNNDLLTAAVEAYDAKNAMLVTAVANPYIPLNRLPFLIGLSYYDWQAIYEELFTKAKQGGLTANWLRFPPNLAGLDKIGGGNVGFIAYEGLDATGKEELSRFVELMASGKINLLKGPLYYKDGRALAESDRTIPAGVWRNLNQLLDGIEVVP